jgi:hypothetical protein
MKWMWMFLVLVTACVVDAPLPVAAEGVAEAEQELLLKWFDIYPCDQREDCPLPRNPCQSYDCKDGWCHWPVLGDGTQCDLGNYPNKFCEAGKCVVPPPPPECIYYPQNPGPSCETTCYDGNPCTDDGCDNGECLHLYHGYGTPCGGTPGYFCQAGGWCCPA